MQRVGDHAADARRGSLSLQPLEQRTRDAGSPPVVCDGDGEFARRGVALIHDVSRFADHGLVPGLVEHLGQQGDMTAVVDVCEALGQRLGQLVQPRHETAIAGLGRQRAKESCAAAPRPAAGSGGW